MSRLRNKPFEILSVSLDDSLSELDSFVSVMNVPGIHTWDDRGPDNPIAELYNVHKLSKWFLIDEKGVIRARDPFGEKLIPAVELIVGRAEGVTAPEPPGGDE